jgi:hypothetical protein
MLSPPNNALFLATRRGRLQVVGFVHRSSQL